MSEEEPPSSDAGMLREAIQTQYEWSAIEPSTAVVKTVAQAAHCDQQELSPLYKCIDPDALDAMIVPPLARNTDTTVSISFTYTGYSVTVHSTGAVHVAPS
ncbi:HalOD1 output domain-containing protein [Haladaptatus pallidirubidus]|uniref:Halobacterial output domain-containing protein n=1 Tax=Haladaptatus pallidirubidus TaxID=1008152 RepID=A0AAV3UMW8_9EURY|nr:HalOD1 output domain-containing protein [Haladaptatus pallidirubidus]